MTKQALTATMALLLASLAGCAQLMPGVANMTARSAENPLGGSPATWSKAPNGLPFEGEKACTTWPIEDNLSVRATEEQICVQGQIHRLSEEGFPGPESVGLGISSDGTGEGGLAESQTELKAQPRKVGQCVDKATGKTKNVWVAAFDSCADNKDPTGKVVLSSKSTYLQVGDARWKFTTATTAANSSP
jgi:hypothetical protein